MKKLKLNKAKLAFDMLEKEMSVINSPEELKRYLGGQQANDCVIAVFNSVDGPSDSSMTYQNAMMANLGYNTYQTDTNFNSSTGSNGSTGSNIVSANNGVKPVDIITVAKYGGVTARNLRSPEGNSWRHVASNGLTVSGDQIMALVPAGSSSSTDYHAVKIKEGGVSYYTDAQGNQLLQFNTIDPQNNNNNEKVYKALEIRDMYGLKY